MHNRFVTTMQKQVYATLDKAQAMAEYRVNLMGRPLWVYSVDGGYSLTSKGHHLKQPPAAMISADEYARTRPQTQQHRNAKYAPDRVYRVLYSHNSNTFTQFFQHVDPKLLGILIGQPGNCLIINLSRRMDGVQALRLINGLRQHSNAFVYYSFVSTNTMMVTNGPTLYAARIKHFNADYIHAAMTAPNCEVTHD